MKGGGLGVREGARTLGWARGLQGGVLKMREGSLGKGEFRVGVVQGVWGNSSQGRARCCSGGW